MMNYFLFFLFFAVCFYWEFSILKERIAECQADRQKNQYILMVCVLFLLGLTFFSIVSLKLEEQWTIGVFILSSVSGLTWAIISFFRNREAGVLLLRIGRNVQNKLVLSVGGLLAISTLLQTGMFLMFVDRIFFQDTDLSLNISALIFFWSWTILSILRGVHGLEFRENGICWMYSLLKWNTIHFYAWDLDRPNILTLGFQPQFLLLANFSRLRIPEKDRDSVDCILEERLSEKSL